MLDAIDFIHEGRRYRARVRPVPGGPAEFDDGAWFVSMNGGPERRVFEAHPEDEDTPEFRHRVVIATWLTDAYDRRSAGDRRKRRSGAPGMEDRREGEDRRA